MTDSYYQRKRPEGSRRGRRSRAPSRRRRRSSAAASPASPPPCRWPSAAARPVLLEAQAGRGRRLRPQWRDGLGRVSPHRTRLLDACGRPFGRPASLMRLSREAMELMRARIARYAHRLRAGDRRRHRLLVRRRGRACGPRSRPQRRFGMRLEYWPRERLRAAYPSPRYWDGMFDPEGFHLDPLGALPRLRRRRRGAGGAAASRRSPPPRLGAHGGRWRVTTPGRAGRRTRWCCARAPIRRAWCRRWRARPCRYSPTSSSPRR